MTDFELMVLAKLDGMTQQIADVRSELSNHMFDESGEIKKIGDKIYHLQMSVSSYGEKTEAMLIDVQQAFLEHPEERGKRDYAGHYQDHKMRKRWYDKWSGWIDAGVGNIVKIVMASGAAWLMYALWDAFLRGPHK